MSLFDSSPYSLVGAEPESVGLSAMSLGVTSERVVEARCLSQGLDVARPSVDMRGVDLIVNRCRVQVKSTQRLYREPNGRTYYRFGAGTLPRTEANRKRHPVRHYTFLERSLLCNVFALYVHDEGLLFLLPSEYVRMRWRGHTLKLIPSERPGLDDYSVFTGGDL